MNSDRLARWDRPIAFLLLGFWLSVTIAVTLVSRGATRIYAWPWAFYLQAGLLAPWFWCAWSMARGRTGLRSAWWVSLPLLTALALSVVASAHWRAALEAGLVLATPLLMLPFLAEAWLGGSPRMRLIAVRVVGAILTVLAAWSLLTWFSEAPDTGVLHWFFTARNPHPLGHWNYNGGLALLMLPVSVLLVSRSRRPERLLWGVSTGLGFVLFLSAGSRGAVLGLIAAVIIGTAALACRRAWSGRALALGVPVLLVIAAAAILTNPRLRQIALDPASAFAIGESEQQRLGFMHTGARIAAAHPWTGVGPGVTPYHYPEYRVDIPGSLENSFQLHCGPLQWCVDTGFIGLALLAIAGGFMKWRLWKARRTPSAEAIAALILLGGYGVLWLTDYQLDVPLIAVVLALATAVLMAEASAETGDAGTRGSRPNVLGTAACVLAVLASVAVLAPAWRARAAFAAAWRANDSAQPDVFIKQLRAATELAPWHPLYHNHLGRALAGAALRLPPESARALRAEARRAWQDSLEVLPFQDYPWLNLGWLALHEGEPTQALHSFERAASIYPRRTGLWFGIALAAASNGVPDAVALAREVRLNPGFITSPIWRGDVFGQISHEVLARLEAETAHADDRGIAAFARWWWMGDVRFGSESANTEVPTLTFLSAFPVLNDRNTSSAELAVPEAVVALREAWMSPTGVDSSEPEPLRSWAIHVQKNPDEPFTRLLRSYPVQLVRQTQRRADALLFRQADGDSLTDLTELPWTPIADLLAPVLPRRGEMNWGAPENLSDEQ